MRANELIRVIALCSALAGCGVQAQNYCSGGARGYVAIALEQSLCKAPDPLVNDVMVFAINPASGDCENTIVRRGTFNFPPLQVLTQKNSKGYTIQLNPKLFQDTHTTFTPQANKTTSVIQPLMCGVKVATLSPRAQASWEWPTASGIGFGGDPDSQVPLNAPRVSLQGKVTVPGNQGVGATVTLSGVQPGKGRLVRIASAVTQSDGVFNINVDPNLIGTFDLYFVSARRAGASEASSLIAGADLASPVQLQLGPPDSGFESARIAPISTTHDTVFHPKEVQNLPLPGSRNVYDLVLLAPGVFPAPESNGIAEPGITATGQFSINGMRRRENNFVLDGSANNDEGTGLPRKGFVFLAPLPVEEINEVQALTAFTDGRFGHNIGGQINLLSLSGADAFHGTAYGYLTDRRLNARNFFDAAPSTRPFTLNNAAGTAPVTLNGSPLVQPNPVLTDTPFTRTQAGFNFGGPLDARPNRDPRTFFLFAFESQITHAARQIHFAVPTVAQRGYLNQGEAGIASVQGNAIFSLYPFANNPGGPYGPNTYTQVLPADADGRLYTVKVDRYLRAFGANNTVTARFTGTNESSSLPDPGGALFASLRPTVHTRNFASFFNTNFPRAVANTFRFDWGRAAFDFSEQRSPLLIPSSMFPSEPFLLNRPLLLNTGTRGFVSGPFLEGLTQTEQITGPVGRVEVAGFSPVGADGSRFPQRQSNSTLQLADTATWVVAGHVLAFGFEAWRFRQDSSIQPYQRPEFSYYGQVQLASLDPFRPQGNILLDPASVVATGQTPSVRQTLVQASDPTLRLHRNQFHFFVHDDFRLPFNLSFNIGLRVEHSSLPQSSDGRFDAFDQAAFDAQIARRRPRCPDGNGNNSRFLVCGNRYDQPVLDTFAAAFPPGFQKVFHASQTSASFRFGLSWSPDGGAKTALRVGVGSYKDQFLGAIPDQSRSVFPRFLPISYSALYSSGHAIPNIANPAFGARIIQPGTLNVLQPAAAADPLSVVLALASGGAALLSVQPAAGLRAPSSTQMGVTFERQISDGTMLSIAYLGTHGRDLLRLTGGDLNGLRTFMVIGALPPTQPPGFPTFPAYNVAFNSGVLPAKAGLARVLFDSGASSDFHSLQAEMRGRVGKRFQFGTAFTFSHSIDDASDFLDTAGSFALPQDNLHRSERGSSAFDQRFRWASHFLWDLQAGRRWYSRGWEISGIGVAQSGQPFTVNSAFDLNQDALLTDRLGTANGLLGPAVGRSVNTLDRRTVLILAPGVQPADLLSLVGRQTAGTPCITGASVSNPCDGAVGRNTFRAGGLYNLDLAISKALSFKERFKMLWRLEAFNSMNHAAFGIPVRILEAPGFGQAVGTIAPNRMFQVTSRFDF